MYTEFADGRNFHWIKPNHATRSPHRWVVIDSEAHRTPDERGERQEFRLAVAKRWCDEPRIKPVVSTIVARDPRTLWEWVSEFTRVGRRTVVWCHNLDYDLQLTRAFLILPELGWDLEWSNLDSQVSMCKWTREGATLVMTDTYTWIPVPLETIGNLLGMHKPILPDEEDDDAAWIRRCTIDTDITVEAVRTIIRFVRENELGNMQMSGAGMGYAMWRHKYLDSKILVHADKTAMEKEREAMHTGRAEAWRHGTYPDAHLIEWDMHCAYTRIARDHDLPRRLVDDVSHPDIAQYHAWAAVRRVLATVTVTTDIPVVPVHHDGKIMWPTGTFTTTLWDCEIDLAIREGAQVTIDHMWGYLRAPIMHAWAEHTMTVLEEKPEHVPEVMLLWYKHQARATIGRLGMRYPQWRDIGEDWIGITGISLADGDTDGPPVRLLHMAGRVWQETERVEGKDSVPQIPSWIMAQCRVMLWEAMRAAGLEHVWYVDTDSVLVDLEGDHAMRVHAKEHSERGWRVKGTYHSAELHGPRQIILDEVPHIAGVPKKARRRSTTRWDGEVWRRMAGALGDGDPGTVRVDDRTFHMRWSDPRRRHTADGRTCALALHSR